MDKITEIRRKAGIGLCRVRACSITPIQKGIGSGLEGFKSHPNHFN